MYASFRRVRGLGYMTVSEMLGGNAGEWSISSQEYIWLFTDLPSMLDYFSY